MTDRHEAVDRWLEWAAEREASGEIVARYQLKKGKLVQVEVTPPSEKKRIDTDGAD